MRDCFNHGAGEYTLKFFGDLGVTGHVLAENECMVLGFGQVLSGLGDHWFA
ncbi:hypothetical protein D3C85_1669740 [compost metagenome]